jgi:CTD small phosphatase-like protein 2
VDGNHLKDLKVLVSRDLSKVILVDNSPHVFGYHVSKNGIPIVSWFEMNRTDNELEKLECFLRDLLANMERDHIHVDKWDARPYLEAKFQVTKLIDEACSSNSN